MTPQIGPAPLPTDALNAQVIAEHLTERAEYFTLDGKGLRSTKTD